LNGSLAPVKVASIGTSIKTVAVVFTLLRRSREDNKHAAYITCLSRIQAHFHKDKERGLAGTERIRTYHEPDNRVTDHASGVQDTYTNVVIKGNIENVIEARAKVVR
jgi:protein subunit release factor A